MEHKKFPLGTEAFEVIDKNKVMESDFVFYTMLNLRVNYGCAIMASVLLTCAMRVFRYLPESVYRPECYKYYMIWTPRAQVFFGVVAALLIVVAPIHLKLANREKSMKARIRRSKYYVGEAGDTILMLRMEDDFTDFE